VVEHGAVVERTVVGVEAVHKLEATVAVECVTSLVASLVASLAVSLVLSLATTFR
jgi:hypothetical protein